MATVLQSPSYADLVTEFGAPYMRHFRHAARGSGSRAVRLQAWDADVGAAFHGELGSVEVALRRRANDAFTAEFGPFWWNDRGFAAVASQGTRGAVAGTLARLTPVARANHHLVVAELPFGTWVALTRTRFFDPVWRKHLVTAFPNLHPRPFADVSAVASALLDLRNAISHHRPIVRRPLAARHADVLDILGWMSMPLQVRAAASSGVPRLLAVRP